MRRVFALVFGVLVWVGWYVLNPSVLPSRYGVPYSDGRQHPVGVVDWTIWLFSPTHTGTAFRTWVYTAHKPLFLIYAILFLLCLILPLTFGIFKKGGYRDRWKSGFVVLPDSAGGRRRLAAISRKLSGVHFSPIQRIDRLEESTHLAVLGSTGSGKTQSLLKLLQDVVKRGDKCLILDSKGDYTSWLCDPARAVLISPDDARTPQWLVGRDIRRPELDLIVQALIEEDKNMSPEWHLAARAALRATLLYTQGANPAFSFHDLDRNLDPDTVRKAAQLYDKKLYDTLRDPGSETGRGVLFVLNSLAQGLSEISPPSAPSTFSVTQWLSDPAKPLLILKRHPAQEFTFRLTARLLLGVLQGQVMSLPEDRNRRIWLIMDELSVLHRFPPLVDFLERGRSKGLCVVGGIQDWGTIEQYYEAESRTLFTCFVNKIFLSMREPVSAKYYSESLGETTYERTTTTENKNNVFSLMPALSTQVQTHKEPAVSQSDLLQLERPDPKKGIIRGFTQITGYPLARISFKVEKMPVVYPEFIPIPPPGTGGGGARPPGNGPLDSGSGDGRSLLPENARTVTGEALRVASPDEPQPDVGEESLAYSRQTLSERFHPDETPGGREGLQFAEEVTKGLARLIVGSMSPIPGLGDVFEIAEVVSKTPDKDLRPATPLPDPAKFTETPEQSHKLHKSLRP